MHLPRSVELYEHVLGVVDDDIIERFSLRDNDGSDHVLRFNLHVKMGKNDELKSVLVSVCCVLLCSFVFFCVLLCSFVFFCVVMYCDIGLLCCTRYIELIS
jgi:hypothetical protein